MKSGSEKRTKVIGVRVSEDEWKAFDFIANEQKITISELLRNAAIRYSGLYAENEEERLSDGNGERSIDETIHVFSETIAKTIKQSTEDLLLQIRTNEKRLKGFIYAFLYHTPEVNEELKGEASRSARKRMDTVCKITDEFD